MRLLRLQLGSPPTLTNKANLLLRLIDRQIETNMTLLYYYYYWRSHFFWNHNQKTFHFKWALILSLFLEFLFFGTITRKPFIYDSCFLKKKIRFQNHNKKPLFMAYVLLFIYLFLYCFLEPHWNHIQKKIVILFVYLFLGIAFS